MNSIHTYILQMEVEHETHGSRAAQPTYVLPLFSYSCVLPYRSAFFSLYYFACYPSRASLFFSSAESQMIMTNFLITHIHAEAHARCRARLLTIKSVDRGPSEDQEPAEEQERIRSVILLRVQRSPFRWETVLRVYSAPSSPVRPSSLLQGTSPAHTYNRTHKSISQHLIAACMHKS